MDNKLRAMIGLMDGRSFTIGREGNIRIDSPTASKVHASIKISGKEIYLRDLNSTNGTYLIVNNIAQLFEEGFVGPHQVIVIGGEKCSITNLISMAVGFSDAEDTQNENKSSAFGPVKRFLKK